MATLVIDNFQGSWTNNLNGDINSGLSWAGSSSGINPFIWTRQLSWSQQAVQIDSAGDVITDLIMDAKERVESNILYVYAIGHTGRLYKIQVNDPTTYNPDYDNPVLLATLSAQSPTFTKGGFIEFFGDTERIYIGHDKGVTRINFDGTSETFVGVLGSWTQSVPRPMQQFVGSLFIGNGTNIAQIDSTATVTTYTKFSPGFPAGTEVRDIDLTSDGNYLEVVVSRVPHPDITLTTENITRTAIADSYIFKWNGTDAGYTAFDTFPSFSITANHMFGSNQYTFGYDMMGQAVFNPTQKLLSQQEVVSPMPNAVTNTGNLATWMSPLPYGGFMEADIGMYGTFDFDIGTGYWYPFFQFASGDETDIIQSPFMLMVSNFGLGSSYNSYTNMIFGTPKIYFSTFETSDTPTTAYRFYRWSPPSSISYDTGDALVDAIYQTQSQVFSRKVLIKELRFYVDPLTSGASFTVDIIGAGGTAMTNGSKTFTAGTAPVSAGDDYIWWNPQIGPTYMIGLLFTNASATNHTINKIEIDYDDRGGK